MLTKNPSLGKNGRQLMGPLICYGRHIQGDAPSWPTSRPKRQRKASPVQEVVAEEVIRPDVTRGRAWEIIGQAYGRAPDLFNCWDGILVPSFFLHQLLLSLRLSSIWHCNIFFPLSKKITIIVVFSKKLLFYCLVPSISYSSCLQKKLFSLSRFNFCPTYSHSFLWLLFSAFLTLVSLQHPAK